jgi:prepilin-type N-terminal cleavage/methylation domain-containing protein
MNARSGFTLIEVLVTLMIFILLTASVFGIMTAVFQSSNALKENQNRKDEISALHAFLKNRFEGLTATDHLESYRRGEGDGLRINGIMLTTQDEIEAIDASRQANGFYDLRLANPVDAASLPAVTSFTQELEKNVDALAWTSLIRDVRSIEWKFQSASSPEWLDEWTSDSTKPSLVECAIQLAGEEQPTVMDFPVPHLVASPSQAPVEVASHAP